MKYKCTDLIASWIYYLQGRIQDFKLGGGGGGGGRTYAYVVVKSYPLLIWFFKDLTSLDISNLNF